MKSLLTITIGLLWLLFVSVLPLLASVWPATMWLTEITGTHLPLSGSPRSKPLSAPTGGGKRSLRRRRRRRWIKKSRRKQQAVSPPWPTNALPSGPSVSNELIEGKKAGLWVSASIKRPWVKKARPVVQSSPTATNTFRSWSQKELRHVRLGDTRLDHRLQVLTQQLAQQPSAPIPQACGSCAATKAAYRFFDNRRVKRQDILAGHRQACLERIAQEEGELLLVMQDTTSIDYSHHPAKKGLGPLENEFMQGFFLHSALAVSADGVPLGLLDQQLWTRDVEESGQRHQRKKRPIEEKESFKWLKGLRASLKGLPQSICVVSVADREADVYDLFLDARDQKTQYLIRSSWSRRLATEEQRYLHQEVSSTPVRARYIVDVGRTPDRLPRQAQVELRYSKVVLRPPRHRLHEKGLSPLDAYIIEVREVNPPGKQTGLHWLLLTNRPVETAEQARCYVRWYGLRWLIERYHFVLKSACRIEHRQLEDAQRLERCLGIYAIVAWRLLWLTYQARINRQAPCTVALERHEWQALYCYIHKTPIPPLEPPTLNQAVRWIAQLGGFLGRKSDGEPGAKVIWRGWQRLNDIVETWLITHPLPEDIAQA